jgi:hypothetical protein
VPFLRVIRDKRGYETTYLMHWFREGNRQRSRILYVFRTPGSVRVGRTPLEPEVLRHIEAEYPDIEFDWSVIRENQQVVEPMLDQRRRRPKREDEAAAPVTARVDVTAVSSPPPPAQAPAPAAEPAQPPIPPALQGTTPDEQIAFLTEWYPIVRDRIPRKTSDPTRVDALLALAERLNPASWTDADQITSGLQEAAQALERLSHVFARRRRRSRRKPAAARPSSPTPVIPES